MKKFPLLAVLLSPLPSPLVVGAAGFKFPAQKPTVPYEFDIQIVADTNIVQRPVSASFDDQGRLYVTDSSFALTARVLPRMITRPRIRSLFYFATARGANSGAGR